MKPHKRRAADRRTTARQAMRELVAMAANALASAEVMSGLVRPSDAASAEALAVARLNLERCWAQLATFAARQGVPFADPRVESSSSGGQ